MRKRFILAILIAIFGIFLCAQSVSAKIVRVYFDAHARNQSSGFYLGLWVEAKDELRKHMPDFIQTIQCIAPDATVLNIDPVRDFLPLDKGYYIMVLATAFKGGVIPGGRYYLTVTCIDGRSITVDDYVKPKQMAIPTITAPTADQTGVGPNLTLRWNSVPFSKYFRVLLYNETWNEPVYWFQDGTRLSVNRRSFTIPNGVLKPDCQYSLRIEARTETQDTDNRSRSDSLTFYTGSW